ncbi:glycoside hydrolase family 38 C-terminal domain-containing protein [soil metagenome]
MSAPPKFDLSRDKVLYLVATSHLDTQWRWTFRDTIQKYIPRTLRENFDRFEKFPDYTFSFEGAFRYMLAKEYYPADFARLKGYIQQGRWRVCGASVDAGDVNTVSPESLIRQTLYGNGFFRREFGVVSRDIFLPDCFGFGWALPAIAAHCGLTGFSTSKLEWGSSNGIPFGLGFWEGVNGDGLVAAINPGQYSFPLKDNPARDEKWAARIDANGGAFGAYADMRYFGLGDTGGAPDEASCEWLERAVADQDAPYRVYSAGADQLSLDLTPEQIAKMPRHRSEFLLTEHGAGTFTSNGAMKKWNRENEELAAAAEAAAVAAEWLAGVPYPHEKLNAAWIRVLANQMHDILPGTSIPEAYAFSWNDEAIAMNEFASVLTHSIGAIAQSLEWKAPLVIHNPLSFERTGIVAVAEEFGPLVPCSSQPTMSLDGRREFLIEVRAPSVGLTEYSDAELTLTLGDASPSRLSNGRVVVDISGDGDITRIFDKKLKRDLLSAPLRIEFLDHAPKEWPAWTILHRDISAGPRTILTGPAKITVSERGPFRTSVDIERSAEGSHFKQRISIHADDSAIVEIETLLRWETPGTLLKAAFPLAVSNPTATYDLGLSVIERGNNHERLYEVPAQRWADITAPDGSWGVAILSDCKFGWDKPADDTLRLTLLHTPAMTGFECHLGGANFVDKFEEQAQLDFGHHHFRYAIMGHEGDWRAGQVVREAEAFTNPLMAFVPRQRSPGSSSADEPPEHLLWSGNWAKLSIASVEPANVAIVALKKAEVSNEYIIRLQETHGLSATTAQVTFCFDVASVREVNGAEESLAESSQPLRIHARGLQVALKPFGIRTLAVTAVRSTRFASGSLNQPLALRFNISGMTANHNRRDGDFDGAGHSLPAELLGTEMTDCGVVFEIAPCDGAAPNVWSGDGQEVALPGGGFDTLHLLACSVNGDCEASVVIDGAEQAIRFVDYAEPIGRWDTRVVNGSYVSAVDEMLPAYLERTPIGWVGTHRHDAVTDADEPYQMCCLFHHRIPLHAGAKSLQLPNDPRIRIVGVTVSKNIETGIRAASPLYSPTISGKKSPGLP